MHAALALLDMLAYLGQIKILLHDGGTVFKVRDGLKQRNNHQAVIMLFCIGRIEVQPGLLLKDNGFEEIAQCFCV